MKLAGNLKFRASKTRCEQELMLAVVNMQAHEQ